MPSMHGNHVSTVVSLPTVFAKVLEAHAFPARPRLRVTQIHIWKWAMTEH